MAVDADEPQIVGPYDYRPQNGRMRKKVEDPRVIAMRDRLRTDDDRRAYAKREQTVEGVFGTI
jgi:hypothetical protein